MGGISVTGCSDSGQTQVLTPQMSEEELAEDLARESELSGATAQ